MTPSPSVSQDGRVLRATGLAGGYGRSDVIRDLDFDLHAGEAVAVLGPNGAGKSTLVRLLSGLLPATAGEVLAFGRPLQRWRRRDLASRVSLVPQLVEFAFPLTVDEVVGQGRNPHLGPWKPPGRSDREAVEKAIARVGVGHLRKQSVQQLSGGERQLVLLARALAVQPQVLLLDEPASALDLNHQLELIEILRGLLDDGVAVLVVLHDWNLALRVADRLVVLDAGRIAAAGAPDDVVSPSLFESVFGVRVELVDTPAGRMVLPVSRSPLAT